MVSIGKTGKGIFSYDVDVSKVFKARKGEAIITLREPTTKEYLQIAQLSKDGDAEKTVDIVVGLVVATTIAVSDEDKSPVNLDILRQYLKDNGSLYLTLYQEWQKMLPFDRSE